MIRTNADDRLNNARGNLISSLHLDERHSVARSLVPKDAKIILDLGCGEGYFLKSLMQEREIEAYGIDISKLNITRAKEQVPSGIFSVQDATNNDFPDSKFDCVAILEVIDHMVSPDRLLQEAHRVLKPGGVLIISAPECGLAWNVIWSAWTASLGKRWQGEHIHEFNQKTLSALIERNDFANLICKKALFGFSNTIQGTKKRP